jgi:hypothetical protein
MVALLSLSLATACSFLLDFDRLQGGEKSATDAGVDSGGSPAADASGAAGAASESAAGTSGAADESSAGASAS